MRTLDHILLVEDDDMVNYYNEFLLKDLGVAEKITIATNGLEALRYLERCDEGAQGFSYPDVIFLDINMPVMNGFEFIEAYEQRPETKRAHVLVVMLTTSLHEKDVERAKHFKSISEYLHKPLLREMLSEILVRYFGN